MTGRHAAPAVGSAAREATAAPYHGKHRAEDVQPVCSLCHMPAVQVDGKWQHAEAADAVFCQLVMRGEPS